MLRWLIALAVIFSSACGGGSKPDVQEPRAPSPPVAAPDPDQCPLLKACYEEIREVQHCPDPVIRFRPNSTELESDSKLVVDKLAVEIKQHGRLQKLLIEGHHAPEEAQSLAESRALTIRTRLVDKGVHEALLEMHTERVRGGSNEVTLHVIDCSGTRQSAQQHSKSSAYWIILY